MAHDDPDRSTRRRPTTVLRAGLVAVTFASVALASVPLAAQVTSAPPAPRAAAAPDARAVTVSHGAPAPGQRVGWREASHLLGPLLSPGDDDAGYRLPVPGAAVRATFDPPATRWAPGHRGVDLETSVGARVLAPRAGVVRFVGAVVDRGVLTIEHADGLRSSIEPVQGQVEVGARVRGGQVLGTVQGVASHCSAVPCVHWGVRRDGTYLDPLTLLPGSGPIVLLPVPDE